MRFALGLAFVCSLGLSAQSTLTAVTEQPARFHVLRLRPGQDLIAEIQSYAKAHSIGAGALVSAVGSLKSASLRFANEKAFTTLKGPLEVVSLSGTFDRDSMHLHMAVSNRKGATHGGHAGLGSLVFTTMELVLAEFPGLVFQREHEPLSGYEELMIHRSMPSAR